MDPYQSSDLLFVDHKRALEFFVTGLKDVTRAEASEHELFYNASILAHFSQVSTFSKEVQFPTPRSLSEIFDRFVYDSSLHGDADAMENAGAQCLLFSGFFADQMRGRHNIQWYSGLGSGFFAMASRAETTPLKASLLKAMSKHFELWRERHFWLSKELRDKRHLFQLPSS